ncbi:MAG: ABC transporter substrate-binding protein [Proteobacteria bacterium]|nr:ABC transporter substrate-binding protein [Pseudomonadota bacterium]
MRASKTFNITISSVVMGALFFLFAFGQPVWGAETAMGKHVWEKWDYLGKPVRGGDYKVASTIDVGLLNPHHWPVMDWNVIDMLMEQVVVAAEGAIMRPWIAESWEVRDPLTFVMKYRKGITFHDGTPLNAAAIKYNMEWVMNKKSGAWTRSYISAVKSIEVLDEYTVQYRFSKPFAVFLNQMQTPVSYTLSPKSLAGDTALKAIKSLKGKLKNGKKKLAKLEKKAKKAAAKGKSTKKLEKKIKKAEKKLSKLEKEYAKTAKKATGARFADKFPVGTGPYMYDERSPGNWIKLKRNPNYWYAKAVGRPDMPYFDTVRYEIIPDRSVQLANLRVGKIHQMELGPAMYNMLVNRSDSQVKVDAVSMPHTRTIHFNHANGPAQDIRIRRAISHAIDRKALVVGARFGLGVLASGIFPNMLWSHNPNLKPIEYNPKLSKQLLREAGYKEKLKLKGHVLLDPEAKTLAAIVKNMLSKVGIEWTYDVLDATAASDRTRNLEFDLFLDIALYIFDPDQQVTVLYHPDGANSGRNNNEKAVALIEAGRAEYDFEKRQQIYWELEQVLGDNYEDIWLWHPRTGRAFYRNVRGIDAKMNEKYLDAWKRSHFLSALWFENGRN